jgi:protein-disulfide isomerase
MTPEPGTAYLTVPVSKRDHAQGPATAAVTLVEYGDYECPYCGQAHLIVQQIQAQVGDLLCFVFRHFPLIMIHPHDEHAAEAAEAAGAQGMFWGMHETLFEHQDQLDDAHLAQYAARLGLDMARFTLEMATHAHAARVREDYLSGVQSGVQGTPTFFINGVRHDDAWDGPTLLAAIERVGASRKARYAAPPGSPRGRVARWEPLGMRPMEKMR